ncbi:MAG: hypothetical protein A4E45_00773 [Methanosaeta sp. PtaB.Bin039]|nr:MAG: hypothetical protein A4E45_00773 [Methanosaeta sp. PtaB.Bin039]
MTPPINLLQDPKALAYLANWTGIPVDLARKRLESMAKTFGPDAAVVYADLRELGEELAEVV